MLSEYDKQAPVTFKGKVVQDLDGNNFLLATELTEFLGYVSEYVLIRFRVDPKLLEGDIIDVKAQFNGIFKYKSVLNKSEKVPDFLVDHFQVIK